MTTLYVGNLKWECNDDELMTLFVQTAGITPAEAHVVFGRNGRSRGYGLVTFNSAADADAATQSLNGYEFQGRQLSVREDRGATKSSNAGVQDNFNSTGTSVFVSNLSWNTDTEQLLNEFAAYNPVSGEVARRNDGKSRGWGTIQFGDQDTANTVVAEMGGGVIEIDGRAIDCRIDRKA